MKRKERLGDEWIPRWKLREMKQKRHERKLAYPPELTNKQRHEIRAKARREALEIVREAGLDVR